MTTFCDMSKEERRRALEKAWETRKLNSEANRRKMKKTKENLETAFDDAACQALLRRGTLLATETTTETTMKPIADKACRGFGTTVRCTLVDAKGSWMERDRKWGRC